MSKSRVLYIDNLRIFLIALVVLHHLAITYGSAGGWYYKEVEPDNLTLLILTAFAVTNQSFFMGMFFLISAYFTRISLECKSPGKFLKDRSIRLGIPLLVFYFILSPLTIYVTLRYGLGRDINFWGYVKREQGFGFGPMWFVETLLIFSLICVAYYYFAKNRLKQTFSEPFPKTVMILLYAALISVVSFVVRLWLPLGWSIPGTGLQVPYFPQYIALLFAGIWFAKYRWFDAITYKQGVRWFVIAQIFIFIAFPLMFYYGAKNGLDPFGGGWTWQSLVLSFWEQFTGFSLMLGLAGIFKKKFSIQNKWAVTLSGAAYATYIVHPLLLVSLSVSFKGLELYPVLKFIVLSPLALLLCFGAGILLKRVPLFRRVL